MIKPKGLTVQLVTLVVVVLIALVTAWSDYRTSEKLKIIHIEVNSNMKEQVRETKELRENLEELRRQFRDETGHEFDALSIQKLLSMFPNRDETGNGHE